MALCPQFPLEPRFLLAAQIERHLRGASVVAPCAVGERGRVWLEDLHVARRIEVRVVETCAAGVPEVRGGPVKPDPICPMSGSCEPSKQVRCSRTRRVHRKMARIGTVVERLLSISGRLELGATNSHIGGYKFGVFAPLQRRTDARRHFVHREWRGDLPRQHLDQGVASGICRGRTYAPVLHFGI